jgi:hypothetical protein
LEYYSKYTWFFDASSASYDDDSAFFSLNIFYNTDATEERTETILYDFGSLLVAAGGNLGLFTGFSCLSILLALIPYFVND